MSGWTYDKVKAQNDNCLFGDGEQLYFYRTNSALRDDAEKGKEEKPALLYSIVALEDEFKDSDGELQKCMHMTVAGTSHARRLNGYIAREFFNGTLVLNEQKFVLASPLPPELKDVKWWPKPDPKKTEAKKEVESKKGKKKVKDPPLEGEYFLIVSPVKVQHIGRFLTSKLSAR